MKASQQIHKMATMQMSQGVIQEHSQLREDGQHRDGSETEEPWRHTSKYTKMATMHLNQEGIQEVMKAANSEKMANTEAGLSTTVCLD